MEGNSERHRITIRTYEAFYSRRKFEVEGNFDLKGMPILNEEIKHYIEKYSNEIQQMFMEIREIAVQSFPDVVEEKMWAKLPSYYVNERFERVIPFKDHINIEASALIQHANELTLYKITPKGMLQVYANQKIPQEILAVGFKQTFLG